MAPSVLGMARIPPAWALATCLIVAAGSVGIMAWTGIPETGEASGHDAYAARLFLDGFRAEMQAGHWWPRWLHEGNRGFGSPAFFFYPPLSFWVAALIQALLGLDGDGALLAATLFWRLATVALVHVWLRGLAGPVPAMIGALCFATHPYVMIVNPLVRFAYAEMAGSFFVVLGLMAAGSRHPLVWVPPAFGLLVLTHLPTAVLAGGVLPAWAFVMGGAGREGLRRMALTLAACALGAALAAAYLVPALGLLDEVNREAWRVGGGWSRNFLLASPPRGQLDLVQFGLMHLGVLVALAALGGVAWIGRRHGQPEGDRRFLPGVALLLGLCLLATPLAMPAWALLTPLQQVQFPWRLVGLIVTIWVALLAWQLRPLAGVVAKRAVGLTIGCVALMGSAALWVPLSAAAANTAWLDPHYRWLRLHAALPGPRAPSVFQPPEYVPSAARMAGWQHNAAVSDARLRAALERSAAASPVAVEREASGGFRLHGRLDQPAIVLLPQFAFPGWTAVAAAGGAVIGADEATGLLRLEIAAGEVAVRVARGQLPAERRGWLASGLAGGVWALLVLGALLAARRRRWSR
jgi:hypothetical protein